MRDVVARGGHDRQHDSAWFDVFGSAIGQPAGFLDGSATGLIGDHHSDVIVVVQVHSHALEQPLEEFFANRGLGEGFVGGTMVEYHDDGADLVVYGCLEHS